MEISRLATMEAQWGPQSSTPGISIDLKEVGRTKAPDGTTQIAWQITGKGYPADQQLVLMRWALDARPQSLMSGIRLDSQGTAVCAAPPIPATGTAGGSTQAAGTNPTRPGAAPSAPAPSADTPPLPPSCAATTKSGQPIELRATVGTGEAVRVALIGQSEKNGAPVRIGAATSLVPFPMENTDKGCKLQVIRGMKNAAMVLVEGTGFPAETTMKVDTVAGGETQTITAKTNEKGRFILAALPAMGGKDGGNMTVRMGGTVQPPSLEAPKTPVATAPACEPAVTFQWGNDSYKPQ
ncbi:MAG TPA: hypothetical protein VHX13_01690 [Acidobacteriaceae bacterium]|nr:hypothetical protein [Acidobacteriaceae bacterium]